jgi:hypothetical protein
MGPTGCPETSVKDYHTTLRNTPEERSFDLHPGGSLKSRVKIDGLSPFINLLKPSGNFTYRQV